MNILDTSALAIIVTVIIIFMQRKTAREKNALDIMHELLTNETLQKGSKILKKYYFNNDTALLIATSMDKTIQNDVENIRELLNYFESLSVGIRLKVYDKKVVLAFRKQQIIHTFEYSKSYIDSIRNKLNNKCLYENLEWFVGCIKIPWYQQIGCRMKRLLKCKNK